MKKSRLLAITVGAAALAATIAGAPAAQAESTEVTFTVSNGAGVSLAVITPHGNLSDPTSSPLGMTAAGDIATVKVTDLTADLTGWTVSAAMADPFTATTDLGAEGAEDDTIPCTAATVTTGVATAFTGTVTYVPAVAPGALALDAATAGDADDCAAKTIGSATVAAGANDATFVTKISVAVPADALAGTYNGTIVQTAA